MKTLLQLKTALAIAAVCLYFAPTSAQSITSRLEIRKGQIYIADSANIIQVDTLIMHDKATIQFDPTKQGKLLAKVAIIGNKCKIIAKGIDGEDGVGVTPGEDGGDGGKLDLFINFKSLGSLVIDLRGGDGGDGVNGMNSSQGKSARRDTRVIPDANGRLVTTLWENGTDGRDASQGGYGGNGGHLKLNYGPVDFTPIFNQKHRKKQSISILYTAGTRGRNGTPGVASFGGQNDLNITRENLRSRDRVENLFPEMKKSTDGTIELKKVSSFAN